MQSGFPAGAYYLAGYAVECGLKACIARRTRRFEFPDRQCVYQSYTHDLGKLVEAAGLKGDRDARIASSPAFRVSWNVVKDWSEESRCDHAVPSTRARDLYRAITRHQSGVMRWVRHHW